MDKFAKQKRSPILHEPCKVNVAVTWDEGYRSDLYKNRVELKDNIEVLSISTMSKEGRNGVNEYGNDLLEQILSKDNMNNAYKRVKANKGSHGIDGITIN